ncbi:uncharacterized protein IWZ02DRAFT_67681 [Phyllosticta citriasiana]|uniref:Uncharacterized protein n=1 Tax=Phyllosticta citriasiana TaxID=595635 RepID=A0ABR1K8K6_9PEZI
MQLLSTTYLTTALRLSMDGQAMLLNICRSFHLGRRLIWMLILALHLLPAGIAATTLNTKNKTKSQKIIIEKEGALSDAVLPSTLLLTTHQPTARAQPFPNDGPIASRAV